MARICRRFAWIEEMGRYPKEEQSKPQGFGKCLAKEFEVLMVSGSNLRLLVVYCINASEIC